MKCWKLAANGKTQGVVRSGVKAWSQIFLGLLAYLVCSAALANDIQMPHLQQAHTLKIVKGP